MGNIITNFDEFVNEEYKLPTTYKFSSAKSEKDDSNSTLYHSNTKENQAFYIISSKENTMRIYEYDPSLSRLHPKMNQWLYPTGAAVQGDRATCLRSPDEVEFYYLLLPSSTALLRCVLLDS